MSIAPFPAPQTSFEAEIKFTDKPLVILLTVVIPEDVQPVASVN